MEHLKILTGKMNLDTQGYLDDIFLEMLYDTLRDTIRREAKPTSKPKQDDLMMLKSMNFC